MSILFFFSSILINKNEFHHDSGLSLRSKRFRLVSEQRKTGFGRVRNETRAKKWKKGEREGKVSFLSSPPLPALLLAPFFAQSLTLVPRSSLPNLTETLATQAHRTLIFHSAVNDIASFLISIACTVFTLKFFMLSELSQSHRTFEIQCTSLL